MIKDTYSPTSILKVSRVYVYKRNFVFLCARGFCSTFESTESEGGTPEDERAQDNEPNDEKAPYTQKAPIGSAIQRPPSLSTSQSKIEREEERKKKHASMRKRCVLASLFERAQGRFYGQRVDRHTKIPSGCVIFLSLSLRPR